MAELEAIMKRVMDSGLTGEVWINGSFMTAKLDPNDCDTVFFVPSYFGYRGNTKQTEILGWLRKDLQGQYLCDTYISFGVNPIGWTVTGLKLECPPGWLN